MSTSVFATSSARERSGACASNSDALAQLGRGNVSAIAPLVATARFGASLGPEPIGNASFQVVGQVDREQLAGDLAEDRATFAFRQPAQVLCQRSRVLAERVECLQHVGDAELTARKLQTYRDARIDHGVHAV